MNPPNFKLFRSFPLSGGNCCGKSKTVQPLARSQVTDFKDVSKKLSIAQTFEVFEKSGFTQINLTI